MSERYDTQSAGNFDSELQLFGATGGWGTGTTQIRGIPMNGDGGNARVGLGGENAEAHGHIVQNNRFPGYDLQSQQSFVQLGPLQGQAYQYAQSQSHGSFAQPPGSQHSYPTSSHQYVNPYGPNAGSQQPQHIDPQLWNAANVVDQRPIERQPQQPNLRYPRFRNAIDAHCQHLSLPGWRPTAGIYGIPMTDVGEIDDAGMMGFVVQLYNAFVDLSQVYDADKSPASLERFRPGGAWMADPDDIEAICHVIVGTASCMHTHGITSLAHKRLPGKIPKPKSVDERLTFAQRIWVMACLVRHYKAPADQLMQMHRVEDYLANIWEVLQCTTDFVSRFDARSVQEKHAWYAELDSLRMHAAPHDTVADAARFQAAQGTKRPHIGIEAENKPKRESLGPSNAAPGSRVPSNPLNQFRTLSEDTSSVKPTVEMDPRSALEEIIRQRGIETRNSLRIPTRSMATDHLHVLPDTGGNSSAPKAFDSPYWSDQVGLGYAASHAFGNPDINGLFGGTGAQDQIYEDIGAIKASWFEHGNADPSHDYNAQF